MQPNMDVIGQEFSRFESWTSKDALLYALGVGAGAIDSVAPSELAYTTENSIGIGQRVLPTFGVIIGGVGFDVSSIGEIDRAQLLHGEQSIQLHSPIPAHGTLHNIAKVTGIFDKGSGMVVTTQITSVLRETGEVLLSNASSVFVRGAGGWGGERGPGGLKNSPPHREPEYVVTYPTRVDQALMYRLSGDRNPLHSDPEFAKSAGFRRPILHGLCTFGFTGRALLHTLAKGDDRRLTGIEARFVKPVYPGEVLTVRIWQIDDNQAAYTTENENGEIVISEGRATFVS